jgi:hypothetical protein
VEEMPRSSTALPSEKMRNWAEIGQIFMQNRRFLQKTALSAIRGLRCHFKVLLNAIPLTGINLSA